jgi:hypothetical protein
MESNTTKFTLDATKKIKALIENDEAQGFSNFTIDNLEEITKLSKNPYLLIMPICSVLDEKQLADTIAQKFSNFPK